ncbi:PH domain-containing protein [Oceanobacillus luteolus]|uniref:PH domain-containing protein n=1 Tax=Oceanobacillus luteolus TaxID=1274358 RepID=A0ABW4HNL9_9BACI|nr:PH domain-containing protein [Oceanobacillus luteolus]MCM3741635.1 PH domain-containing protein [Oceanobacillus luteolus]
MYVLKEPTQKISPDAIKVWRITDAFHTIIFLGLLSFLLYFDYSYQWPNWIGIVIYSLMGITFVSAIIELIIVPVYKQRTWRYEIDGNCIQLKHGGAFKKTHMIIPMNKVYFVDTYQGPILQRYKLATVKIGTVGYIHEIPGLPERKASEIRSYIASLTDLYKAKEAADGEEQRV